MLQHEYGHYLWAQKHGYTNYLFGIAIPNLLSAVFNSGHKSFYTEVSANKLAVEYFGPNSAIALDEQYKKNKKSTYLEKNEQNKNIFNIFLMCRMRHS